MKMYEPFSFLSNPMVRGAALPPVPSEAEARPRPDRASGAQVGDG